MAFRKTAFAFLAFILVNPSAYALTMTEFAGTYLVTHPEFPIRNQVSINKNGQVQLTESSPFGRFECSGHAKLEGSLLVSQLVCQDGKEFEQRIDLAQLPSPMPEAFTAPVYSSLYNQTVPMNFEKLK